MSLGRRKRRGKQESIWIEATSVPTPAGHPFYERLNKLLESRGVSSQNKCEYELLRANWARIVAHYLRMKDVDSSLRALILLASEAFIVDV
jgi:hypothetical protein